MVTQHYKNTLRVFIPDAAIMMPLGVNLGRAYHACVLYEHCDRHSVHRHYTAVKWIALMNTLVSHIHEMQQNEGLAGLVQWTNGLVCLAG